MIEKWPLSDIPENATLQISSTPNIEYLEKFDQVPSVS